MKVHYYLAMVAILAILIIEVANSMRIDSIEHRVSVLEYKQCLLDRDLYYTWEAIDGASISVRYYVGDNDADCRRP